MKKFISTFTLLIALFTTTPSSLAQENANVSNQASNLRFWEAKLPGGSYMVALSRISSISMSTYYVTGAVVHEVDIETMGAALTRFYTIEALGESNASNAASNIIKRAKSIGQEAGNKAGANLDTAVTKEYPLTTHAKTIEFRVVDKADLNEIYKSLSKSWKENRGRKITIK